MSYLADIEYEPSEVSTDPDNISEYSINSINDKIDDIQAENRIRYTNLLNEKYMNIVSFNSGGIDPDIYFTNLNRINNELEQLDYEDNETNYLIIEQELKFQNLLDELTLKIKKKRESNNVT